MSQSSESKSTIIVPLLLMLDREAFAAAAKACFSLAAASRFARIRRFLGVGTGPTVKDVDSRDCTCGGMTESSDDKSTKVFLSIGDNAFLFREGGSSSLSMMVWVVVWT